MYVRDVHWHSQMLHWLEEGNVIPEDCVFPVLAHGDLRASGCFCTLGKTHRIFHVVEKAWTLELDTPSSNATHWLCDLGKLFIFSKP